MRWVFTTCFFNLHLSLSCCHCHGKHNSSVCVFYLQLTCFFVFFFFLQSAMLWVLPGSVAFRISFYSAIQRCVYEKRHVFLLILFSHRYACTLSPWWHNPHGKKVAATLRAGAKQNCRWSITWASKQIFHLLENLLMSSHVLISWMYLADLSRENV